MLHSRFLLDSFAVLLLAVLCVSDTGNYLIKGADDSQEDFLFCL